jgi:hypothetical protein
LGVRETLAHHVGSVRCVIARDVQEVTLGHLQEHRVSDEAFVRDTD